MSHEFALRLPQPDPGQWAAGVLALLVHAFLAALLFFGVQWQTQPQETVAVELYRAPPPRQQAAPPPPPQPPVVKVAPQPAPPPRPAAIKPDIALKEKPLPKPVPKIEPKPVPKVEAKPPPKPEPKAPPKPEAKVLPKPEAKALPKTPDWSKELASTEQSLSNTRTALAAADELKKMKSDRESTARNKALATWGERIAAKVRGKIMLPPSASGNPVAEFDITLLPDGSVLSAKLRKSTGNPALDAAIERAIGASTPLPLPDTPGIFQRDLRFVFRPLENP